MLQMIKDLPVLPAPRKVRIKFTKGNDLIYISHLDLVRTLTRAIIRARIPVKYTEGYNPIPKLVFATPLSVGCASECEFLDIRIDREMTYAEIKEALSCELPYGMNVVDVYEPASKFTEAIYSGYEIMISDPSLDNRSLDRIKEVFSSTTLVISKRSKSGEKQVDIKPFIKRLDAICQDNELKINTLLSVSSADYLNPEYIVDIIYNTLGLSKDNYNINSGYAITRKDLYLWDQKTLFR